VIFASGSDILRRPFGLDVGVRGGGLPGWQVVPGQHRLIFVQVGVAGCRGLGSLWLGGRACGGEAGEGPAAPSAGSGREAGCGAAGIVVQPMHCIGTGGQAGCGAAAGGGRAGAAGSGHIRRWWRYSWRIHQKGGPVPTPGAATSTPR